jgi:hypothetical protein
VGIKIQKNEALVGTDAGASGSRRFYEDKIQLLATAKSMQRSCGVSAPRSHLAANQDWNAEVRQRV